MRRVRPPTPTLAVQNHHRSLVQGARKTAANMASVTPDSTWREQGDDQ
jgi:hypothetical protein